MPFTDHQSLERSLSRRYLNFAATDIIDMFATWFREFTAIVAVKPRTFFITVPLISELRHITIKNIAIVKGAVVIKGSYK